MTKVQKVWWRQFTIRDIVVIMVAFFGPFTAWVITRVQASADTQAAQEVQAVRDSMLWVKVDALDKKFDIYVVKIDDKLTKVDEKLSAVKESVGGLELIQGYKQDKK